MNYYIMLGEEGPTDSTLVLKFGDQTREFLIESSGWRILRAYIEQSDRASNGALPAEVPAVIALEALEALES